MKQRTLIRRLSRNRNTDMKVVAYATGLVLYRKAYLVRAPGVRKPPRLITEFKVDCENVNPIRIY